MSSHREAPEISKDPVADNTDVYAFVSPDKPETVTLIANFIPFQNPQGGPNFYEFGDDVLYEIHISNRGDARSDVIYQFRFTTKIRNQNTFLYNTGPIGSIERPELEPTAVLLGHPARAWPEPGRCWLADLTVPPVNVGIRSTPDYAADLHRCGASTRCTGNRRVFAGQRADAFFVDLGSIFDLGALRPFQNLHLIPSAAAAGVNGLQGLNVHSIAIQVPISDLTRNHNRPTNVLDAGSVIGVWATASRRRVRMYSYKSRPVVLFWASSSSLPARQPAVQRGHHADGQQGPLESDKPRNDNSSPSTSRIRNWRGCCPCSTRACFPTSRRTRNRGPICSPSC